MEDNPTSITTHEDALEAGYFGTVPDETPNEAYTLAGVTSSDEAAKADRRAGTGQGNIAPDPVENPNPQREPKSSSRKSSS